MVGHASGSRAQPSSKRQRQSTPAGALPSLPRTSQLVEAGFWHQQPVVPLAQRNKLAAAAGVIAAAIARISTGLSAAAAALCGAALLAGAGGAGDSAGRRREALVDGQRPERRHVVGAEVAGRVVGQQAEEPQAVLVAGRGSGLGTGAG